jgi:pimeloyl-ACP methyl ester carboxylesterase
VLGEDDSWIPVAKVHELALPMPGAHLRLIPGAGHLVPLDASAQPLAALLDFLAGDG